MSRPFALTPTLDEQEAEYEQERARLEAIGRAALRARQLLADLDAGRSPAALDAATAGLKHELNTILGELDPLPEEWRRVVAPHLSEGMLTARDQLGDPPLFDMPE